MLAGWVDACRLLSLVVGWCVLWLFCVLVSVLVLALLCWVGLFIRLWFVVLAIVLFDWLTMVAFGWGLNLVAVLVRFRLVAPDCVVG